MNIIKNFLETELSDQEFYIGIIDFVSSQNIRCGEYEGHIYIIKKIDTENFLIFTEHIIDGERKTSNFTYISKKDLKKYINDYAIQQGYK